MNDNEIIKALECCIPQNKDECKKCPFRKDGVSEEWCDTKMLKSALDLINRLQAEVEQWKEEANKYQNLWCEAFTDIQTTKSEARKEFAERLKSKAKWGRNFLGTTYYNVDVDEIDNLLAEMDGKENGSEKVQKK